jgi:hypothetical protein
MRPTNVVSETNPRLRLGHQQDDIRLAVLEIALLALLVPNFSRLELVTYIVIDSLVLGLELEKN